jgi:hypothetical protein
LRSAPKVAPSFGGLPGTDLNERQLKDLALVQKDNSGSIPDAQKERSSMTIASEQVASPKKAGEEAASPVKEKKEKNIKKYTKEGRCIIKNIVKNNLFFNQNHQFQLRLLQSIACIFWFNSLILNLF